MIVVDGLMIILIIILAIKLWNCENRLDIAKSDIDELYGWVNEHRERFSSHKELIEALSKSVRELNGGVEAVRVSMDDVGKYVVSVPPIRKENENG